MDALVIRPFWANKIFREGKCWEIRGSKTNKRGRIYIAKSMTSKIYGTVKIIDCIPLTKELWESNKDKHQVNMSWEELLNRYKTPYAWVLDEQLEFDTPIGYYHKPGAVIWVKDINF